MPKVSVIIPCYNQGAYLEEAVESVLAQTYLDFEILVVDDGSTDEQTVRLLEDYVRPKTRVIHTENQGLSAARNTGIREARGAYILPLDADDKIGKGYLDDAVRILDRYPEIGIVYCEVSHFGIKGGRWDLPQYSLDKILNHNVIFCTALYRKADWEAVGGYNVNMVYGWEDWDFWLSLIHIGRKVYRIPKIYFYYRLREDSMIHTMDEEQSFFMRLHACLNHPDIYRHMVDIQIHLRAAELYLDTGLGFSHRQVLRKVIFTDQKIIEFDLSNYRGIRQCRFDPINAPASIHLKGIRMIEEDGTSHDIEDFQDNAHYRQDRNLVFSTADPQIIFPVKAIQRPSRLVVQLTYNAVGPEVFHDLFGYQEGLLTKTQKDLALRKEELSIREAELSALRVELSGRETELQNKNAEIEQVRTLLSQKEKTIEEIYDSRSWRVTRPIRSIKERLHGGVKKSS